MAENTVEIRLAAKDEASAAIGGVVGQLRGMMVQLAAMAGLASAGAGLGMLAKRGIEFNKAMEDTKGGIAGVLLMTREYVTQTGKVAQGQEAVNAAFAEAAGIQEKLKKDALGTAASYTELVGAFNSALAPAAAAGVTNLEDVREITVMATQAMAALNIPTVQAAQELRGLFSGDTGPDNRLNQILRVTKGDLEKVKGNTEAAAKLFKDRLGPAASAAAMQTGTLTVRLSNLGDILDQTLGDATSGLFKDLSGLIVDLTTGVGDSAGVFKDLAETVRVAFGVLKETISDVFGTATKSVSDAGTSWREIFLGIATVFLGLVESLSAGAKWIAQVLTAPVETLWGVWKTVVFGIASLFSELLLKLADLPVVGKFFKGWSMGVDDLVVSMTTVDEKFGRFAQKAEENFGEGALARTKKFLDGYAAGSKQAGDEVEKLGSRAKKGAQEAGEAAFYFGSVWRTGSAEASKALEKIRKDFDELAGDRMAAQIAEIAAPFDELAGQIGFAMGQGWIALSEGLDMLRKLSEEKGKKITASIFNGEAAVEEFIGVLRAKREQLQKAVADIFEFHPDDAKAGAKAGLLGVFAALPSAAESAAAAVQGVWGAMAKSFDDLFYNVLSGRLDSLKDVFKGLWDSVLQTFSKYLSEMLQRWIQTQIEMGQASYTGKAFRDVKSYGPGGEVTTLAGVGTGPGRGMSFGSSTGWGSMGAGYANGGGWSGAAMGAGMGYGFGTVIGSLGNGKYNQMGGQLGGAIGGAVFGVVGAVVGSLIGTLIGALSSPNTEKHIRGALGNMIGSTVQKWVDETTIEGPRGPKVVPGHWETTGGPPSNDLEREGQRAIRSQTASFADLFRLGAKDQARELLAAYQKALGTVLAGASVDIAAGSEAHLQQNQEYVLTKLLPRLGLSAAFGQKGYLPVGNRDAPGGVPGIDWKAPGMDEAGNWIEKQLFDPNAPIPKMLAGLGFTEKAIGDLAQRISTDDPAKLLTYIQGVVGVVVGLKSLGTEMGKSFEELSKGWDAEAAAGPVGAFRKQADSIAGLFENLTLYSGDEQLQKAQEAQAAAEQFWGTVLDYLARLKALAAEMSASIQSQRVGMRDFLNPKTEAEKVAGAWETVGGGWGKLLGAKTADEALTAANGMRDAIDLIFGVMAERITAGKALLEKLGGLSASFSGARASAAEATWADQNPIAAFGKDAAEIARKVSEAARLSGSDQIRAIEAVAASAEEMYARQAAMIRTIAANTADLEKSVAAQKWELGLDGKKPAEAATYIQDRIKFLQDAIRGAGSSEEVKALTSEIQSLLGRYLGTFADDDPNRDAAKKWISDMLDRTLGLAKDAYGTMTVDLEKANEKIRTALEASGKLIGDNVSEAADWIKQLSHTLGELGTVFGDKMRKLGDDALAALDPLRTAMKTAGEIYTGAMTSAANALTAPETGFEATVARSTAALGTFEGALLRVAGSLGGIGAGGGGQTQNVAQTVPAAAQSARVDPREVIPMVRRYFGSLTPRTY